MNAHNREVMRAFLAPANVETMRMDARRAGFAGNARGFEHLLIDFAALMAEELGFSQPLPGSSTVQQVGHYATRFVALCSSKPPIEPPSYEWLPNETPPTVCVVPRGCAIPSGCVVPTVAREVRNRKPLVFRRPCIDLDGAVATERTGMDRGFDMSDLLATTVARPR